MSDHETYKVCAVCNITLERLGGESDEDVHWLHISEAFGKSDHVAVPVDASEVTVRQMCDFCFVEIPTGDAWEVPSKDFLMPIINVMSVNGFCACPVCKDLVIQDDWAGLIERAVTTHLKKNPAAPPEELRRWLILLYDRLRQNMTVSPRPWPRPTNEGEQP